MEELQNLGFDLGLTGFDETEIADLFDTNSGDTVKDDDFDLTTALEKAAFVQRGDIWTVGRHKLMCGDATSAEDVSALMAPRQISFCPILPMAFRLRVPAV